MRYFTILLSMLFSSFVFAQSRQTLDSLKTVLETVYKTDQELRITLDSVQAKYGFDSPELKAHWASITRQDSINQHIVTSVIDNYGWLSAQETSDKSNSALFLIIQHAAINIQLKYLPVLKAAVEKGKAKSTDYALLVDRTNMAQGKFQVYGSQIINTKGNRSFFPIVDEPNINNRRKVIGLNSMQEYAASFGLTYTVPKIDSLENKIVIIGHLFGQLNQGYVSQEIAAVKVYWGNNKLLAQTDETGTFRVLVNKSFRNWAIIFKKEGFESASIILEGKEKDVFETYTVLRKITLMPNKAF